MRVSRLQLMGLHCPGNKTDLNSFMKIRLIALLIFILSVSVFAQDSLQIRLSYNALLAAEISANYKSQDSPVIFSDYFQSNSPEKKSVAKAMFFSLLIPGAGEYYVGETGYTKFFLGMEILAWSSIVPNICRSFHNIVAFLFLAKYV